MPCILHLRYTALKKTDLNYCLIMVSTLFATTLTLSLPAEAEKKPTGTEALKEPAPQLVLPLTLAEKQFYIAPMLVPENSTLEKTLDEAGLAKAKGKYEEARMLYKKALADAQNRTDKTHKIRGALINCQIAECLFLNAKVQLAELLLHQSLEALNAPDGNYYIAKFPTLLALGYLYLRCDQYSEATAKFEEALKITKDPLSMQTVKAKEALGLVLAKQKKLQEAKVYFEESIKLAVKIDEDPEEADGEPSEGYDATNYANLAYCNFMEGNLEEAAKNYVAAEKELGEKLPTESKTAIEIMSGHIAVLKKLGRDLEAQKLTDKVKALEARPITFIHAFHPEDEISPEVVAYLRAVQTKIKTNWHPTKEQFSNQAVVVFKVLPDGKVKNVRIVGTSGNDTIDKRAMEAVETSAPFGPLPALPNKARSCNMEMTFDYNLMHGRK